MSKNVLKENAAAFALYLGLTLAVFWPCLSSFSTALIGPPEDNMQFYWFLWNGHRTLATGGGSFLHTNLMYYPEGASLLYANYYYYGVFLTLVLKPLMSLAAVFNFLVMHSFVLAAFFAFILIRYLSGDFWASLAGGLIFGFNPSHFAHSLHH
ncbi:MAG: hypothetical protein WCG06_04550, partial [Candidatus Omnitrophota bacterium]